MRSTGKLVKFWALFFFVLRWSPRDALSVLYWRVTRRRLRAANLLRRSAANIPAVYSIWIDSVEQLDGLVERAPEKMDSWRYKPLFSIVIHAPAGSSTHLQRSIRSVHDQIYPLWEIVLVRSGPGEPVAEADGASRLRLASGETSEFREALSVAAHECEGDYTLLLRAGDELCPAALFWAAEALQSKPSATIVYGDEDELDAGSERSRPWFKPAWNPEMFLALDYVSSAVALKVDFVRKATSRGSSQLTAILLEATDAAEVVHIPHILFHLGAPRPDEAGRAELVARHLEDRRATVVAGPHGTLKVQWPLPSIPPTVSIIVPTRDSLELLKPCVDSVLDRTNYARFEVIIVDNGSVKTETLSYLRAAAEDERVRVLRYDRPYNYSAINNFAANAAHGEYLCLLNNDTEVLDDSWLTEMMRYAVRSDVGAVGAKLLYPDRTIQHAGVIIGMGGAAGHPHRFADSDSPGYFRQTHVAQFVSAVTAACLVVDKAKFLSVGGLDETEFAVAYNDVDLCLKLQREGLRNVYTPHAVLLHYESMSRGTDMSKENLPRYRRELNALRERWGTEDYSDPLHNPNLDRNCETFVVRL